MHKPTEIRFARFQKKMEMIRHTAVRKNDDTIVAGKLPKFGKKQLIMLIVMKHDLTLVAAIDHTINSAGIFNA